MEAAAWRYSAIRIIMRRSWSSGAGEGECVSVESATAKGVSERVFQHRSMEPDG